MCLFVAFFASHPTVGLLAHVMIAEKDVFIDPFIQPDYLQHATDQEVMVGGMESSERCCIHCAGKAVHPVSA